LKLGTRHGAEQQRVFLQRVCQLAVLQRLPKEIGAHSEHDGSVREFASLADRRAKQEA